MVRVGEVCGLKKIGGSGAESCECIGRAYTFFENHINSISDLVQELRQGSYFASDHLYSAPRKYTEATLSLSQKSIPADIKENGERAERYLKDMIPISETLDNLNIMLIGLNNMGCPEECQTLISFYERLQKKYSTMGEVHHALSKAEIDKAEVMEVLSLANFSFPDEFLKSIDQGYSNYPDIFLRLQELIETRRLKR